MTTRCVCGATFTAPTHTETWAAFDHHIDQEHGRRFPKGAVPTGERKPHPFGKAKVRKAPLTHQGGNS